MKNSKLLTAGKSGLAVVAMIAIAIFASGGADVSADEPAATLSTFMVFADGVEGREDEFNNWYEGTHLGEVLQVPGFVSAQRFEIVGEPSGQKYVAVYEIEGDPQAALTALYAAVANTMNMSDSMNNTTVVTKLYAPRTAKISAE
jgi:hypothetical protein